MNYQLFEKYPDIYKKTPKKISIAGNTVLADIHDLDIFKLKDFFPREGFVNRPKIITDVKGKTFAYLKTPFNKLGKMVKYELSRPDVFITEDEGKTFFKSQEVYRKNKNCYQK